MAAGCGKACELVEAEYKSNNEQARRIKEGLLSILNGSGLSYHINGDQAFCLSNTLNLCIEGVS